MVVNGNLTQSIPIDCEVPQGSSISCFLFTLQLEPLLMILRKVLTGIKCSESTVVMEALIQACDANGVSIVGEANSSANQERARLTAPLPTHLTHLGTVAFCDDLNVELSDEGDLKILKTAELVAENVSKLLLS